MNRQRALHWIAVIIGDPAFHFLAAGALLFAIYELGFAPASAQARENIIVVDRPAMLNFLQNRAKAFQPEFFSKMLDEMPAAEKQAMIDEYVREEVLFREATAMGLESGDYVIRQRLVQKLQFLIEDAAVPETPPVRAELERYYAKHKSDYEEQPVFTFTHVFFDAALHGDAGARSRAEAALRTLNRDKVGFNDASEFGDRFLYFQNYVDRTRDFVVSHFGPEISVQLDRLEPSATTWSGPFRSPYGWHAVLLTRRVPARFPELFEIEQRIVEDYRREMLDREKRAAIDGLLREYHVVVRDSIGGE